jgi:citrate lyase subunit beta / citryl-CoA lyase
VTLNRPPQPPIRSLLYVPGNKLDWMLKAPQYGADALIFDLEDSVPADQKADSRKTVRQAIDQLGSLGRPRLFVRINAFATGMALDDLEAIVAPGLFGIQAPKIEGPQAIQELDSAMTALERKAGLPEGQIFIQPLIESAEGVRVAYEIAMAAARVGYLMGAAGGNVGDMAQSVGYRETTGLETAYIFGKIVIDARAAGITNPCTGLVTDPIRDLEAVRARATRARNFGYMGSNLIHPSHIQLANEVFGPSKADVEFWTGLVAAVEEGERRGTSAVLYQGRMMDIAHMNHARNMLNYIAEHPELNPG